MVYMKVFKLKLNIKKNKELKYSIFLYINQGFLLQITDTFANYDNQYLPAMKTLKNILSKQQYTELATYSE